MHYVNNSYPEHTTYDHRSVKTGHPVQNPLFSSLFAVTGSQRVVTYTLWEPDVLVHRDWD
jgi:hypothetical protein